MAAAEVGLGEAEGLRLDAEGGREGELSEGLVVLLDGVADAWGRDGVRRVWC